MKTSDENEALSIKMPTREVEDRAKVRLGGFGPSFPVGQRRATNIPHTRKIRMASMSPGSPPVRVD
jgi:hypothetical protein